MRIVSEQVIERLKDTARFIASHEEHQPILLLFTKTSKGDIHTLPVSISGHPGNAVPEILRRAQPDAYVLVTEARYKMCQPEDIETFRAGDIASNPDNPELLMLIVAERYHAPTVWKANITSQGTKRRIAEWAILTEFTSFPAHSYW